MMRKRAGFVTAVAAAVVLGVGGLAVSASTVTDTVYTACVNDSSGALRLIDSSDEGTKSETCTKREHPISWNAQGPAGPSGLSELAGMRCAEGKALVGFTATGGLECESVEDIGGGDPDGPGGPVDTDEDGTPDVEDRCPAVPTVVRGDVSYDCPAMLGDLLDGAVTTGTDVYVPNLVVAAVTGNVVTLTDAGTPQQDGEARTIDVVVADLGSTQVGSLVTVYGVATYADGQWGLQLAAFDLLRI